MGPRKEVFDVVFLALGHDLHRAIRAVLYPAAQTMLPGLALRSGSKVDALHAAANDEVNALLAHSSVIAHRFGGANPQPYRTART